jgi:hypothetical protein
MRHENKEGIHTLQASCLFSFFRLVYAFSCPNPLSIRPHPSLFSTPPSLGVVVQQVNVLSLYFRQGQREGKLSRSGSFSSSRLIWNFHIASFLVFIEFLIVTNYTQQTSSVDTDSTYKSRVTSPSLLQMFSIPALPADTLNLCSSLNMVAQVSHQYGADEITVCMY